MSISITEIAKRANVSATTVSRALNGQGYVNEETRSHILEIAAELGYQPKKYKKRQSHRSSNVIGLIVPDLKNSFFAEIIQGIENEISSKGYELFICTSNDDSNKEIRCITSLVDHNICGLIIAASSDIAKYNTEYLKELNETRFPVVLVDRHLRIPGLDCITFDNYTGAFNAVQALINNGHKDIAILSGPITSCTGLDRLNGYMDALKQNQLPIHEEYIMYGDFGFESGYNLTKKILLHQKKITAFFVCNRRMCIGCLHALNELGLKIPEDMALISFGKTKEYLAYPRPLSHVYQPVPPLGEEAARILLSKLEMGRRYRKIPNKQSIFSTECFLCGSEVYPANRKK